MYRILSSVLSISSVILISACSSGPPKPVLPDGSQRVPVNQVPPDPAASAPAALPAGPAEGGGR
jgi:hypothetical protein